MHRWAWTRRPRWTCWRLGGGELVVRGGWRRCKGRTVGAFRVALAFSCEDLEARRGELAILELALFTFADSDGGQPSDGSDAPLNDVSAGREAKRNASIR